MVLTETCTAEVSSGHSSHKEGQALSDRGSGPQGLRRPRFSFFLFTCQTAGNRGGPTLRWDEGPSKLSPPAGAGCVITSSVRSFEGAPSHRQADGTPLGRYIVVVT